MRAALVSCHIIVTKTCHTAGSGRDEVDFSWVRKLFGETRPAGSAAIPPVGSGQAIAFEDVCRGRGINRL